MLIASQSCSRSGQREAARETRKFIITLALRAAETELRVILKTGTTKAETDILVQWHTLKRFASLLHNLSSCPSCDSTFFFFAAQFLTALPTRLQVATAYFSCSLPDVNFLDPYFIFMYMHNNNCHRATAHLQLDVLLLLLLLLLSSSSSLSSPLCWVFILIFLRQTISLGNTVLQLFCCYYSWCLYR